MRTPRERRGDLAAQRAALPSANAGCGMVDAYGDDEVSDYTDFCRPTASE